MRVLVACALLAVVAGKAVERRWSPDYDYHRDVGVPMAARIKAAEDARDFDGTRITGGSPAALGQYPWFGGLLVHLSIGAVSVCGSTLLSNTRGLTAAHCWHTATLQADSFTVVLGSVELFYGGTRIDTSDVEAHAGYDTMFLYNDIAIIRLPWVTFNDNILPIPIATGTETYAGTWAVVAGFGLTGDGASILPSQVLSHVPVQVITNAECSSSFGTFVVDSTLCVATTGGRGPCSSDSGGPLVTNNQLIGVVSFGAPSCQAGIPAGFARVTYYSDWINARL